MFELNDRGEMPFHNAVKCAIATLTDKIISSENDLVGVCFYGTVRPPPRSAGRPCSKKEASVRLIVHCCRTSLGEEEQSQRL